MKKLILGVAFGLASIPAQSATVGMTCSGDIAFVSAETMAKANSCAATQYPGCSVRIRANGGYYAIATNADGRAKGGAAGFRRKASAVNRAISKCEALGAGSCALQVAAFDNGAGSSCD